MTTTTSMTQKDSDSVDTRRWICEHTKKETINDDNDQNPKDKITNIEETVLVYLFELITEKSKYFHKLDHTSEEKRVIIHYYSRNREDDATNTNCKMKNVVERTNRGS